MTCPQQRLRSAAYSGLTVSNSFVSRNRASFANAAICQLTVGCLNINDKVITAVIGPAGTTVPAGSTLFTTVQDAVTAASQWDLGNGLLQLPAGTFAEDIVITGSESESRLTIQGIVEPQFGLGWMQGGDNNSGAPAYPIELGVGTITLTALGNAVTITASGTNPLLQNLNIIAGDRLLSYNDNGSIQVNTVVSIQAPNLITFAGAAPVILTPGASLTFLPRTEVLSVSSLERYQTGTTLASLYVHGPGVVATDPDAQVLFSTESAVVQINGGETFLHNNVFHNTDTATGTGILYHSWKAVQTHIALSTIVANWGYHLPSGVGTGTAVNIFVPNSGARIGFGFGIDDGAIFAADELNVSGRGQIHLLQTAGDSRWTNTVLTLMDGTVALSGGEAAALFASGREATLLGTAAGRTRLLYNDVNAVSLADQLVEARLGARVTLNTLSSTYPAGGLGEHIFNNGAFVYISGAGDSFATTGGSFIVLVPGGGKTIVQITGVTWAVNTRVLGAGDEVQPGDNALDAGTGQEDLINTADTVATRRFTATYTGVTV